MKTNYKKSMLTLTLGYCVSVASLNAQNIAAGGWHSLAICNDSTVKAFGENATGQLGNGTMVDKSSPVPVAGLTGIVAVSGGGDMLEAHSMALKNNGTVWTWGSNIYGGLGNGSTVSTMAPVQVLIITGVSAISAGGWHSVALKSDGTVWTWGWNMDGQLGDGTTVDKTTPVQVPGLSGITKISAGTYHVLALKNDGTVWAWGDNISGQIGDGTTVDKTSPVQVSGLSGIIGIAAGRFFSLAVKNDGTAWSWGENLYGQLGDGTKVDKSTPVQVSGLSGIVSAVAATGAFHCMAAKSDNTVWAWGRNTYGNLGDNSIIERTTPVQMTGVTSVAGLAAGTNFSLLYKSDGTFWGCGRNSVGQLGDGSTTQRIVATQATGVCSVLQPLGLNESSSTVSSEMKAFPNPSADGKYTVVMTNDQSITDLGNCRVEVYNALGQIVIESSVEAMAQNGSINIDLSAQTNGVYYLKLKSTEGAFNYKLMKQ